MPHPRSQWRRLIYALLMIETDCLPPKLCSTLLEQPAADTCCCSPSHMYELVAKIEDVVTRQTRIALEGNNTPEEIETNISCVDFFSSV